MARLPDRIGTVYRGGQGQWSWALHRITGIAVIFFLYAHILDTSLVAFGPDLYNRVVGVYHHPLIRLMEMGLAGAVLFHALNGIRIIVIDFFPRTARWHRQMFGVVIGLYIVLIVPAIYFMGRGLVEEIQRSGLF